MTLVHQQSFFTKSPSRTKLRKVSKPATLIDVLSKIKTIKTTSKCIEGEGLNSGPLTLKSIREYLGEVNGFAEHGITTTELSITPDWSDTDRDLDLGRSLVGEEDGDGY